MFLNGSLGETDSVSQTEYDVTAYRNVLDQLQTIEGELNKLRGYLRADLALSVPDGGQNSSSTVRKSLSGWAMQRFGGKDPYRWSKVISQKIGLNVKNYQRLAWNPSQLQDWVKARAGEDYTYSGVCKATRQGRSKRTHSETICSHRSFIGAYAHRVSAHVFDVHNLIRNVNWELNRLRIEIPFDLRQLTNQMNLWAGGLASRKGDPDTAIKEYKLFEKVEELRNKIIPKMKERLNKKIKEAELAEKVAADEIRKENEKTITKGEREEQEKKSEQKTSGTQVPSSGGTGLPAKVEALIKERDQKELRKTIADNEKLIRELSQQNGDQNGAMLPLGALALLLLLGQG